MGMAWSSIYPSWPELGTVAWLRQAFGLFNRRLAYAPITRPITKYLVAHSSGSSAGGGGAGTLASPWLVDTPSNAITLMGNNIGSGGVAFLFARSTTAAAAGGTHRLKGLAGMQFASGANCTLGAYGSGDRPVLDGFVADSGTGWTAATGCYYKTVASAVYWVRKNEAPSANLELGTETVFKKSGGKISSISIHATAPVITTAGNHGLATGDSVNLIGTNSTPAIDGRYSITVTGATTFTVSATTTGTGNNGTWAGMGADNSWAYDATNTRLVVRNGANLNPATNIIEMCQAANYGLYHLGVDGWRVDNWVTMGWGMDAVDDADAGLMFSGGVTDEIVYSNCASYYGGKGVIQHLGNVSGSGSIATYDTCKFGLGIVTSGGAWRATSSFSASGGWEHIFRNYDCQYGALPDTTSVGWNATTVKRGGPGIHHTGSGSHGLAIILGGTTRSHTYSCETMGGMEYQNAPAYTTNRAALTEYRSFAVAETSEGGANTNLDSSYSKYHARKGCRYRCRPKAAWTSEPLISQQCFAAWMQVVLQIDLSDLTTGGQLVALLTASGAAADFYLDTLGCHIDFLITRSGGSGQYAAFDGRAVSAPWRASKIRHWDLIFSVRDTSGGRSIGASHWNGCPNGAPTGASSAADSALTGGGRNCAFRRVGGGSADTVGGPTNFSSDYLGHDAQPGYIDLTSDPTPLAVPSAGGELFRAGTTNHPYRDEWWYDMNNDVFRFMPAIPSVGPIQEAGLGIVSTSAGTAALLAVIRQQAAVLFENDQEE